MESCCGIYYLLGSEISAVSGYFAHLRSLMNPLVNFSFFPKITNRRLKQLADYFSDYSQIGAAEFSDLVQAGWEDGVAHEFVSWRENFPAEKAAVILEQEGIWPVSIDEPAYPVLLKQISDPPYTIFVRGTLPDESCPSLGVVGTRRISPYGAAACAAIVPPLAKSGMIIVSGLALGLDGLAHEETLKVGGITVAVLGGGIDRNTLYPASHRSLSERIIASGGAIVSEYPPGFKPTPYTFPARNRIIAGLTLGTLVIEAPEGSGALITARMALDYNREVLAVPHPIGVINGEGNNRLIKQGARLVSEASDVLETLNIAIVFEKRPNEAIQSELPPDQSAIYQILSSEAKTIDRIAADSGRPGNEVSSALSMLEIKGLAKGIGNASYIKV